MNSIIVPSSIRYGIHSTLCPLSTNSNYYLCPWLANLMCVHSFSICGPLFAWSSCLLFPLAAAADVDSMANRRESPLTYRRSYSLYILNMIILGVGRTALKPRTYIGNHSIKVQTICPPKRRAEKRHLAVSWTNDRAMHLFKWSSSIVFEQLFVPPTVFPPHE